jgi:ATP-dependent Lhr-like helicase
VASRYPSFPIVLEAYRECLRDVFDLPGLVEIASRVRRREIRLVTVDTQSPSPFSASLLFGYVANYLYDGDAPLAERRAQALAVDQAQLRELLGEAELRELIDRQALGGLETTLQALDAVHQATSPERLHDLLLRLGDLSLEEAAARVLTLPEGDAAAVAEAWLAELERERRAIRIPVAGDERWAAAEDAGRLRDALGISPPPGLPAAFLERQPRALREVVSRYARTHGPFVARDVARRYATGEAPVLAALTELAKDGRVLEGEFRPGGHGREWCGKDVLATLRRRSLAALRKQVEPAEPSALARLLADWQGVASAPSTRRGPDALLDVIEQLQGAVLPASILERDVLPARIPGYRRVDFDTLCAAGEVVWVGLGELGDRDGRLSLFLADDLPLLRPPRLEAAGTRLLRPSPAPADDLHGLIREHLKRRGASFFGEIHAAAGEGLERPVQDALWSLAWAGEVTNDTPEALRAFLSAHAARAERRGRVSSFRSRRQVPPSAVGRWSLLPASGPSASPTVRMKALAEQLLKRHGILTRDAVAFEEVPGGFSAVYPVLRALEEAGRIRRGYFAAGLGGLQFADPGALDRLRVLREPDPETPEAVVLAAADPANPYGAALAWPRVEEARLARAAGLHVVLADGVVVAVLNRGARQVTAILPEEEPARSRLAGAAARALRHWCEATSRPALGWAVGEGTALAEGPLAPFLAEAGFVRSGPGFRLQGAPTLVQAADDDPRDPPTSPG